jgi:predicted metal-dependent hydrolase
MKYDERYLRGIDHFNRREFFEAHEVWEDLWIETNDDRKAFYHGLIQAAVALHHALRGNAGGARSLYARMRNNLDMFRPDAEGLDVDSFLRRMAECCEPLWRGEPIDRMRIPTIALKLD